jgi:hypothetical protein
MTKRGSEDITLPELLNQAIDSRLADVNVCLPGIVESYDRTKQTAKIQPALKRKYLDGRVVNLPIINNVPIVFPRSSSHHIHFDLKKGDYVTLIFSQRSLDSWKESGGLVSPNDPRRFNLSDAYGIPGGFPKSGGFSPRGGEFSFELTNEKNFFSLEQDGTIKAENEKGKTAIKPDGELNYQNGVGNLTVKADGELNFTNGDLTFTLKPSGKVTISNASEELISLLSDLLQEIIGANTLTLLGLQPLVGFGQTFPVLKTKIDTFKE